MVEKLNEIDLGDVELPTTEGMTTKVVKGSLWTVFGQMLPLFASLLATPFIIRFLGTEAYGVLILIGLIPNYFAFADLGMAVASTKFGAEAYGQGLQKREGEIVRTAALIALVSSLFVAIPIFIFSSSIIGYLNVPDTLQDSATTGLRITTIAFVLGILATIVNTPQLARLRMELNTIANASPKVLMALSTPFVLYFGGGIVGAVYVVLIAAIIGICTHIFFSGRLLKELFRPTISIEAFKPLLVFGIGILFSGLAIAMLANLEKFVLTRIVSVKSLAYYSIAFTLANTATMFSLAMIQSLIPAFARLLKSAKRVEFNELFSRSMRLNLIGLFPSMMFLFVIAYPFFTIWAGREFGENSTFPFYVLLAGLFFNILAYIPFSAIIAHGRTDIIAKLFWIQLIPYAILVVILVSNFQLVGAAMAWSLRLIIDAILQIWLARKFVGASFNFSEHALTFFLSIVILLPPILFSVFMDNSSVFLAVLAPLCAAIYFLMIWRRFIRNEEKLWFTSKISKVFS